MAAKVKLSRVRFRDAVNRPLDKQGRSPGTMTMALASGSATSSLHDKTIAYDLSLNRDNACVSVVDRESGDDVSVPLSNVMEWKELREEVKA